MKISSLVVGATVAFVCVLAEARAEAQGELSGGVYTITVAADARLVAKKKLTVVGKKIGFAEGATVNIDDLDTLVASDKHVFTLMSSDVGIVGPVPSLGPSFAGTSWRVYFSSDGKSLKLNDGRGMSLIVR